MGQAAPYLRDIMDALSAKHLARRIVFMKGAQTGGSEAGNNWLGYVMRQVPAPMLAVQPTVALAKRFSRQRIAPCWRKHPRCGSGSRRPARAPAATPCCRRNYPVASWC